MNKDLIERNKEIRRGRPKVDPGVLYSVYEYNGVFQICFRSRGCTNYLNGTCIMCDYGIGSNINPDQLSIAFDRALSESKEDIRVLLLNSFGSVLDENEISKECFNVLLDKIRNTKIKNIIFETHYTTINKEKLGLIKRILKDKNIIFELGLETSCQETREKCLLKYINNDQFLNVVRLIHLYDMKVIANLLVGIPFLSEEEQVQDVVNSIKWCFEHSIDEVNLFPLNIRPYTLLRELFDNGKYKVISHWMLIEVLSKIDKNYLSNIYFAWYGNRDLKYDNGMNSIFPTFCDICQDDIIQFYELFLKNKDLGYRDRLVNEMISKKKCKCYKKF